jgi:hypothetical protein
MYSISAFDTNAATSLGDLFSVKRTLHPREISSQSAFDIAFATVSILRYNAAGEKQLYGIRRGGRRMDPSACLSLPTRERSFYVLIEQFWFV